jgi:hypothetical protein
MQFARDFLFNLALSLVLLPQAVAQEGTTPQSPKAEQKAKPELYQNFSALLKGFSKTKTLSAKFQEEKQIEFLVEPLSSSGVIYFDAPGERLSRHTEKPFPSILVIAKKWVGILEDSKWEEADLDRQPVIMQIVSSFVMLLSGDEKGLEKVFKVVFTPETAAGNAWEIRLEPLVKPINKIIKTITFHGKGVVVSGMELLEVSGDKTVTRFSSHVLDAAFTKKEMVRFFPTPERKDDSQ